MGPVLTGIYSLYNADADLKAALTGGLHLEMAPQGTDVPYGTFNLTVARPDYFLGGEMFEIITIQFDIYALSNASRQDIYNKLTALYDDARPTVTGYTSIVMQRNLQQMLRAGDNGEGFRAIVEYELTVEKN